MSRHAAEPSRARCAAGALDRRQHRAKAAARAQAVPTRSIARQLRRTLVGTTVGVAALFGGPQVAGAATVTAVTTSEQYGQYSTTITYTAGPGELNALRSELVVNPLPLAGGTRFGVMSFTDSVPVTAGAGCTSAGTVAKCNTVGIVTVTADLGDGADSAEFAPDNYGLVRARVEGRSGDDRLLSSVPGALMGGDGADLLKRGQTREVTMAPLSGGAGNDVIDTTAAGSLDMGNWVYLGPGEDVFRGAHGPDTVAAHDGERDILDCGGSVPELVPELGEPDRATVDRADVAINCEDTTVREVDDGAAPSSQADADATSTSRSISVRYAASDPEPSSGLAAVELWAKGPADSTFRLAGSESGGSASGTITYDAAQEDGTYAFYSVAVDRAGNREEAPSQADTSTRLDTTVPIVTSVTPADGATGVSAGTAVSVAFSEPMNRTTAQDAFSLKAPDGSIVTGSFSWNANTLAFRPAKQLQRARTYTATVGAGARDAAGNALASQETWRFTTR